MLRVTPRLIQQGDISRFKYLALELHTSLMARSWIALSAAIAFRCSFAAWTNVSGELSLAASNLSAAACNLSSFIRIDIGPSCDGTANMG